MKELDNGIVNLICKYLTGTITDADKKTLDGWLTADAQRRALIDGFRDGEEWRKRENLIRNIDVRRAIRRFEARTGQLSRRRLVMRRLTRYAAVVVPVVAAGLFALHIVGRNDHGIPDYVVPGGSKATLYAGGVPVALGGGTETVLAFGASKKIRFDGKGISYDTVGEVPGSAMPDRLVTARGGEFSVELSDGTRVWLNSETVLEYDPALGGERREVTLTGEAFFEVKKGSRPFIVNARGASIEVTGTSFGVSCYPGSGSVAAVLETGGINFVTSADTGVPIYPGERVELNSETGEVAVRKVDPKYFTAWRHGSFYFDDTPLSEIVVMLGRWYDVDFVFTDPSLETMRFSGVALRSKPLDYVLGLLEQTRYIRFSSAGERTIEVKKV